MASSLVVKDIQDSPVLGTMVGGEWVYTGK